MGKNTRQASAQARTEHDSSDILDVVRTRKLRTLAATLGSVAKLTDTNSVSTLRVLKEELTENWSEYIHAYEKHEDMVTGALLNDKLFEINREYVDQHNRYVAAKIRLADLFESVRSNAPEVSQQNDRITNVPTNFKMPPIKITPFNGNLSDWMEFKATCDSVLINTIPEVQRLQYLKDALVGEPRALITHIMPVQGSYLQALNLLRDRYENMRAIVNEQLRKFYAMPCVQIPSAKEFRSMLNTTNSMLAALKGCGINTDSWNSIIIFTLTQRFDKTTLAQWENKLEGKRDIPSLKSMLDFLSVRITIHETTDNFSETQIDKPKAFSKWQSNHKPNFDNKKANFTEKPKVFYVIKPNFKCVLCTKNHLPSRCDELSRMAVKDRQCLIKQHGLCENCFYPHKVDECPFQPACRKCANSHNTLLHSDTVTMFMNIADSESDSIAMKQNVDESDTPIEINIDTDDTLSQLSSHYFFHVNEPTESTPLLATAVVPVRVNNRSALLKSLIDNGSTANLISLNACNLLKLNFVRCNIPMLGVGDTPVGKVLGVVYFEIGSIHNKNYKLRIRAIVVNSIGESGGFKKNETIEWSHIHGLPLADPTYTTKSKIDLLLGTVAHAEIVLPGIVKGQRNQPIAQNTELGWILSGSINISNKLDALCHHIRSVDFNNADTALDNQLKAFWELEEVTKQHILTTEEQLAEDVFKNSVRRADDGKFIVDLPFKLNPDENLGESRSVALRRYKSLQNRFAKHPELKVKYDAVLEEYLTLNHMQLIDNDDIVSHQCFLPHHAILKESSTTTKVRSVIDASAKTSSGISLNNCLSVGPVIQPELFDSLLNWRKFEFAVSADIEKMYRMIYVNPDHANYQTILWHRPGTDSIAAYKLLTVTFGTSSAPFQATRGVYEVGERIKNTNPELAEIIQKNFYVDDFLKSFASVETACNVRNSITEVLADYGFNLRKWKASDKRILEGVNESDCETGIDFDSTFKTLGIAWQAMSDEFIFKTMEIDSDQIWTKRKVLSAIAKLFDPLGWLAPFIVRSKIFMQELWRLPKNIHWDSELPEHVTAQWKTLFIELTSPIAIKIPRWLKLSNNTETVEIHAFSDASNLAYAGCVYVRVIRQDGSVSCNLVAAKTRVAPIKTTTIPRLELCGAVLASRLTKRCIQALALTEVKIFSWSDSKIVLAWLATHPNKWTTFVANRVSEIQQNSNSNNWLHIPSKQNPADIASRGSSINELKNSTTWWNGPSFLNITDEKGPKQDFKLSIENAPEKKKVIKINLLVKEKPNEVLIYFSSYDRLLRFTCLAMRWLTKSKTQIITNNPINAIEIDLAEKQWIKLVQREYFGHDIGRLRQNRSLPVNSKLSKLNPFIDEKSILRMNGRVGNSEFIEQKYSIVLPSDSHFTSLLIQDHHEHQALHGGVSLTLQALRQKFWIIHARNQVKRVVGKCMVCFRTKKKLLTQQMADLPSFRTRQAKPFTFVGTDYAGYFDIKTSDRKNAPLTKGYVVLFICLTTKAIHLELASDLSTAEFIIALENLITRRGTPDIIWSDNAKNYVGADKEIHALYEQMTSQTNTLTKKTTKKCIQFKRIPARASHMAGIWERAVGMVKYHLKRVMKDTKLTARRFDHVLKQIECCLNSRPLWYISPNADDIEVITPSHFFNFEAINTLPRPDVSHIPMNRLDQYQYLHRLYTDFWKGWSKEYVDQLQPRQKWCKKETNVRVGQIVVISDDNIPPSRWPVGKISAVYPGKDGLVRTVEVLCNGSTLKRPIHRLGLLPILDNDDLTYSNVEQINAGQDVVAK